MKDKKNFRTCLLVVVALLLLALIVFIGYSYLAMRVQANIAPPQVLIHRPTNFTEVSLPNAQVVHATARAEGGVSRVELWVDGKFISAQDAPESGAISPLVLNTYWQPQGAGRHEIVVRAYDVNQVEGTGSILVTATEPEEILSADIAVDVGIDPLGLVEGDEIPSDMGTSGSPPQPSAGGDGSPGYSPGGPAAPPSADEVPPDPVVESHQSDNSRILIRTF